MSVSAKVLFDNPQQEIASLLRDRLDRCTSASLVAGFMTVEGIKAIADPLRAHPAKLNHLVVGAGTYRAFEACDRLIDAGVNPDNLHVHFGFTRETTSARSKYPFLRYHPMLHSKVYLMEMGSETSSAFIGSHNLTGFALMGLNGEAGVLLEGPSSSAEFDDIRNHITEAVRQAVVYDPSMKDAYTWWAVQFIEGLRDKFNDRPRDAERKRTIVLMAECSGPGVPDKNDVIYFEIPEAIGQIASTRTDVHLFLFDTLPPMPAQALNQLHMAKQSFWCRTIGLEDDRGGVELRADWEIQNRTKPTLIRTPSPFRPTPQPEMQQVRIKLRNDVFGVFEYLFDSDRSSWLPSLDDEELVQADEAERGFLGSLELIPREDLEWYRVNELVPKGERPSEAYRMALNEMSPQSGNYILMSLRRRKRKAGSDDD